MASPEEHPKADEIRGQVEHYFSDENLLGDMHLKKKMLDSGDGTVLLKEILGFPRMHRYKPKTAVIAALKQSTFLQISDDNKYISRTEPFTWPDNHIADDYEQQQIEWKARGAKMNKPKQAPLPVGMAPKLASGMDKPTGFEDAFVEGPITPVEYAEERLTYDPEESITERLSIAIHRYTTRRKFHQKYALIFSAFMRYGGVEGRGNQFQGGSIEDEELQDMTPGQLAHFKCSYDVGHDKDPEEGKWELDFEGVAKGFLSSRLPVLVRSNEYPLAIRILTNFYNYLLVHDVFHQQQEGDIVASIKACITLCKLAAIELPKVQTTGRVLPGDFNVAASVLSDGFYSRLWADDKPWMTSSVENPYDDETWGNNASVGMPVTKAKVVFSVGVAAYGGEELFRALDTFEGSLVCTEERDNVGLEVLDVTFADAETCKLYDSDADAGENSGLKKLGKLTCQEWTVPSFHRWDLPSEDPANIGGPKRYEFWVEDAIMESIFPGMKLEATLRKLAFGSAQDTTSFWTIDTGCRAYCSFYTYLPNELITREPKPIRWLKEGEGEEQRGDPDEDETSER